MKKKDLELLLSLLKNFEEGDVKLEQYLTPSFIAAEVLWDAFCSGNIDGKKVADLGCGNGIFGIGALILGAKRVIFLDVDEKVLRVTRDNLELVEKRLGKKFKCEFVSGDVVEFNKKVDVVFQNPPFGTKREHADREFLEVAMENSDMVYSFHKSSTMDFIKDFFGDNGFKVVRVYKFKFPLKKVFGFHRSVSKDIDVSCFGAERFKKEE